MCKFDHVKTLTHTEFLVLLVCGTSQKCVCEHECFWLAWNWLLNGVGETLQHTQTSVNMRVSRAEDSQKKYGKKNIYRPHNQYLGFVLFFLCDVHWFLEKILFTQFIYCWNTMLLLDLQEDRIQNYHQIESQSETIISALCSSSQTTWFKITVTYCNNNNSKLLKKIQPCNITTQQYVVWPLRMSRPEVSNLWSHMWLSSPSPVAPSGFGKTVYGNE